MFQTSRYKKRDSQRPFVSVCGEVDKERQSLHRNIDMLQ